MSQNHPPPGRILFEEVMVPLGLSLSEAAAEFDISPKILAEVVAGNASIPQELADGLERAGFSTARFWMALQTEYVKSAL